MVDAAGTPESDRVITRKWFDDWRLGAQSRGDDEYPYRAWSLLPATWPNPKKEGHFLEVLFGSSARARALAVLVARTGRELHLTDLARKTRTTPATLRKVLAPLLAVGILQHRMEGNRLYLKANPDHPAHPSLVQLIDSARAEPTRQGDGHE